MEDLFVFLAVPEFIILRNKICIINSGSAKVSFYIFYHTNTTQIALH